MEKMKLPEAFIDWKVSRQGRMDFNSSHQARWKASNWSINQQDISYTRNFYIE